MDKEPEGEEDHQHVDQGQSPEGSLAETTTIAAKNADVQEVHHAGHEHGNKVEDGGC